MKHSYICIIGINIKYRIKHVIVTYHTHHVTYSFGSLLVKKLIDCFLVVHACTAEPVNAISQVIISWPDRTLLFALLISRSLCFLRSLCVFCFLCISHLQWENALITVALHKETIVHFIPVAIILETRSMCI